MPISHARINFIEKFLSHFNHVFSKTQVSAKLLNEKQALREKLGKLREISGGWLEHATKFVTTCNEIGSVAWQENSPPLRDFLKMVGSNFILKNRSLLFTYSKPFDIVAKSQGVLDWRARADSNCQPADS